MCGCDDNDLRITRGAPAQPWEWEWYGMGAINQQTATGPDEYRAPARTVADRVSYPERSEFHIEMAPGDIEIITEIDPPEDDPLDLESHVSGPVEAVTRFVENNSILALAIAGAGLYYIAGRNKKK